MKRFSCLGLLVFVICACNQHDSSVDKNTKNNQFYLQQLVDNKYDSNAYFQLGNLARQKKQWTRAYAYYLNAIGLDKTNRDYALAALELEIASRRWPLAQHRLTTLSLKVAQNLYYQSQISRGKGDLASANKQLTQLLQLPVAQWIDFNNPAALLVNIALKTNQQTVAKKYLALARQHYPEHRATMLAEVKFAKNIDPVDRWLDKYPDDIEALFVKAQYLMATQKNHQALAILENAHSLDTAHVKTALLLGENLAQLGRFEQLQQWLNGFEASSKKSQGIKAYLQATVAFSQQNYPSAAKLLFQASSLLPQHPQLIYLRGMSLYAINDLVGALPLLEQVVGENPSNNAALLCLAETYMGLGRPQQAISTAVAAWQLNKTNVANIFTLAKTYQATGQVTKALALLQGSGPQAPVLTLLKARLQLKNQRPELAEKNFLKVLATDPDNTVAMVGLIDSYLLSGQAEQVEIYLESKNSKISKLLLATIFLKQQDYSSSLEVLEKLISTSAFNPVFYLLKAQAEQKLYSPGFALSNIPSNKHPMLLQLRAQLAAQANDWPQAVEQYQLLLGLGKSSAQVYNGLAWALFNSAKPDQLVKAKQMAQRAYLQEPKNPHYQHTLDSIKHALRELSLQKHALQKL